MTRLICLWRAAPRRWSVLLLLLAAEMTYRLTRDNTALMDSWAQWVAMPVKRTLTQITGVLPFSLAECLLILCVVGGAALLGRWLWLAVKQRWGRLGQEALSLLCVAAAAYVTGNLLWGTAYYGSSFGAKTGLNPQPITVEQLAEVTAYFGRQASEACRQVPRDAEGHFAGEKADILAAAPGSYQAVEEEFPFLRGPEAPVKRVWFSKFMSRVDLTGFYCVYTGEANLNCHSPAVMLPSTICHEIAHQRGVAPEQEANFAAVLAATRSQDPMYVYSGWLLGYIHLNNALYEADPDRWEEIYTSLDPLVRLDLEDNNAYWRQFDTPLSELGEKVNDAMLKSNGQTLGVQSYGAVVDLLAAYYQQQWKGSTE
ncbi:MAG: DUF3810 domain-containing protein [Eubacteriales bacterium]|jgi:hypothetical protein